MRSHSFLGRFLLALVLVSFVLSGIAPVLAQGQVAAPGSPTDESKVPHYFGPYPNWANSPFTLPDVTVTITGDGSGATAVASVGANGTVTGITLTDPGFGYTAASVLITGAGNGATATAQVAASGAVTGVTVDSHGSGYTAPTVVFTGGGGPGGLVWPGNPLGDRSFATDVPSPAIEAGITLSDTNGVDLGSATGGYPLVVLPTALPAGTLTGFLSWNQAAAGGSPTPSAGQAFTAYVLRPTGTTDQYSVVYASGPLTVPALTDPAVSELARYPVDSVDVQAGDVLAFYGAGMPADTGVGADIVSYPGPSAPLLDDTITLGSPAFTLLGEARAYSFAASVIDISRNVDLVPATAIAYGSVYSLTLTSPGSGYTFPTVDFDMPDAPDGVIAAAHATADPVTGAITAIVLDNHGSGYSAAPSVVIRNGTIWDPLPGGTGAAAATRLRIDSIAVTSPGDGYISAPGVVINDPTGQGAHATAQVSAGSVNAIILGPGGSGYITAGGIEKFTDPLPGLCVPPACPTTGKYIPLAVAEAKMYNGIQADEYEIGVVQYRTQFSSSLPPTLVRGYVQLETVANAGISQHFPLTNELLNGTLVPIYKSDGVTQWLAVTPPQWLGPIIAVDKNKPVRIVFYNLLPTGSGGNLFLPVDSTLMGSGMGPMDMMPPADLGSVTDGVRNPACTDDPQAVDPGTGMGICFKNDRATVHLHGGISPWISDGTPHQWITPADEMTPWPQGVSVSNVPDMAAAGCDGQTDGCMTFYYTNQQSARLLFYHDHAWGITRLNVYAGEAAGYLISDATEQALLDSGTIPGAADTIPLVIQDRTFVPQDTQMYNTYDANGNTLTYGQDPTWDSARWGGYGNFWYHHVYMPAQNPGDPSGMSAYGRWMYGPWFWPPAANTVYGPIANPYYNMDPLGPDGLPHTPDDWTSPLAVPCNLDDPATWQYQTDPFCEPEQIPGTPNLSVGMEQFNDTPIVNGVAYPTITLEPKTYRFRILSAANDRFFNFQWYVGDPSTASTGLNNLPVPEVIGATEVALDPALVAAAQTDPNVFPTPVQGAATAGPDWIQIGTEGGFLPAPAVIDGQQPTTWIIDPTRFDVGNVDLHSLALAPAERADVIVDFSQFAGKTLILYNDAPAAFPARVASYDYYLGAPDMSPVGAPAILPGYGPNTRTIMQVKIAGTAAPAFNLTKLQSAFKHKANGTGVFESGQHPIIVGQAAYNSAYGTNFAASSNCNAPGSPVTRCDGFVRVSDTLNFGFNTLKAPNTKMTMPLQPKALHDEMNATTFDEFGRMQANIGVEAQPPVPGQQNVVLYPFVNPATELIDGTNLPKADVTYDPNTGLPVSDVKITPISSATDGTQIWRITHNGVDTHPIHWHLFDVQLLNRVTWDNIILPPEAGELGWRDTLRISPLEDTIVALRPIIPEVPWELPNAIRNLSPMMPAGSTAMFNNIDPQGNPTAPIVNQLVNSGWEYMYHCHILSHEEMDMMRPVSVALPPLVADGLSLNRPTSTLTWNDNSINETSFVVQRSTDGGTTWTDVGSSPSPLDQPNTHGTRTFTDTTYNSGLDSQFRVVAQNTVGYGLEFPSLTASSTSAPVIVPGLAAPTNLDATAGANRVRLRWVDNALTETGFVVERSTDGVNFSQIATLPANLGRGGMTYFDTTAVGGVSYQYRVAAVDTYGLSAYVYSNWVLALGIPPAPSGLTGTAYRWGNTNFDRVTLNWTDNSNNETGFTVQRSLFVNFSVIQAQNNVGANTTTFTTGNLNRFTTYYFRVRAYNTYGQSAWSNVWSATTP